MKKIYRDEKGRFCKRHNSVEEKPKRKKRKKEWREANLEREKAKRRGRYQANKEKERAGQALWREKNPTFNTTYYEANKEKELVRAKSYHANNREEVLRKKKIINAKSETKVKKKEHYEANKETYANRQRVWRSNPEKRGMLRAQWASARAKRLQREISLDEAGRKEIAKIFAGCPEGWHVDHIVPLLGETISGLHVPDNLQHLPKWVNHMKGNRWEESWIEHTIDTPLEEKIKAYQLNYEGEKWHE